MTWSWKPLLLLPLVAIWVSTEVWGQQRQRKQAEERLVPLKLNPLITQGFREGHGGVVGERLPYAWGVLSEAQAERRIPKAFPEGTLVPSGRSGTSGRAAPEWIASEEQERDGAALEAEMLRDLEILKELEMLQMLEMLKELEALTEIDPPLERRKERRELEERGR